MEVRFWGTRGSLPASIRSDSIRKKVKYAIKTVLEKDLGSAEDIDAFIDSELPFWVKGTYGNNTSCVEIREGNDCIICDAGSGLRDFSNEIIQSGNGQQKEFHIFLSHLHWDHLQGFPFFIPAIFEGNHVTFYGCHEGMEEAFFVQHSAPFFPLVFEDLKAEINFVPLVPDKIYEIKGFKVKAKEQNHPGRSFGYRFERKGKTVVYSTDSEHKIENQKDDEEFIAFFSQADLLIFDAQYSFVDAMTVKQDWGHSNNFIGVELALEAGVKHLCMFHNEPASSDEDLDKFLLDTKKLATVYQKSSPLKVSIAWDGLVIEL